MSGTQTKGLNQQQLDELVLRGLPEHPYFIGCQYHPEFQSKPTNPHPLFRGFVEACLATQEKTGNN